MHDRGRTPVRSDSTPAHAEADRVGRRAARALTAVAATLLLACLAWSGVRAAGDDARLPAPAYPKVLELASGGHAAQAIVQLDEQIHEQGATAVPMAARLLRAHLLDEAGRAVESAAAWRTIADDSPALHDYALRAAFAALVKAGRLTDARASLDLWSASHGGRPDPTLQIELAAAFDHVNAAADAGALYQRVLDTGKTGPAVDTATLALATIKVQQHDDAGALALLRRAELNFDSPSTFAAALAAQKAILQRTGGTAPALSADQYGSTVARLNGYARYEPSLALIDEWAASPAAAGKADDIANTRIATLYAERDDDRAMAAANHFLAQFPDSKFVPDVRTIQFRLDVREGRTRDVKSRGLALWLGRVPGVSKDDRFSLGRLLAAYLVGVGEVKQGLSMYRRLYEEAASRDDRADILWRAGVAAIRMREYSRAVSNLTTAIRLKPGRLTERLCRYWLAVAQIDEGHRRAAVDTAIDLLKDDAYDYYSIEALKLIAPLVKGQSAWAADVRNAEAPAQTFPALAVQPATRQDPDFVAATQLAGAGFLAGAAEFANRAADHQRGDAAAAMLAARALSDAGRHGDAVALLTRRFGSFLSAPASGVPDDFWSLMYPRAYWKDVRAAAAVNHVDPLLLLAIMRQESRFDATAVSRVGAIGLFQVMTYTAADLHAGDDPPERADLLKPSVSAQMGARLVKQLMARFDGAVAPVVAAYNAGDDLVSVWWKSLPAPSEALFVDTMPYAETRNYARSVLTNYYTYQRLYGENP
ncbi:MAG TPA: lytic transglycosylase domain-containing protein [Vicinamibacterales bacterium]